MMLLNAQALALAALFLDLATGRPLDSHDVLPRDKSYAVVNVGGDSPTQAPPTATRTVATTKTVEVVNPGKTVTQEITTTVVQPEPAPAPTSSCTPTSSPTPASSSTPSPSTLSPTPTPTATPTISSSMTTRPTETPKPIFITVTVSEPADTTEYYDDGMWHTRYAIKSFEATPSPAT